MNADASNPFTLIGIFFLGLGLNLTPCVYPLLAVTVSLFSARKDKEPTTAESFFRALIYVLGMAVTNTTLAVIAALTGGLLGAILQNRWVLIGVSGLLSLLALSMFGVYSLQAPSWILNKVSGKRSSTLAGLFLSGLIVGIFAAPCIGPPILALLTWVGTKGDPVFAVLVFFVLSMGLGFPYLILGTFSKLLSRLPKSGVWLVWIDRLFGIILLALSAFYFSLAVYPPFLKWILPVFLIGGGIYLGFINQSEKYSEIFNDARRILSVLAIFVGLVLPFLGPKQKVEWQRYSPQKLEQSIQNKRPVVLDFYADWCIPCHELDQVTYSDAKVIEALKPFDLYKVDLTDQEDEETLAIAEKYSLEGVPTIVFLDPVGKEIPETRISGFVPPNEFIPTVNRALDEVKPQDTESLS